MKNLFYITVLLTVIPFYAYAQSDTEESKIEKIRTESGVDPTRVSSRMGYSIMYYDMEGHKSQINNRLALNLGINRWSLTIKADYISANPGTPGAGFNTGLGDTRFTILNAFYVKGKNSMAGSVEFGLPTGRAGLGTQYFSATPSITFAHSFNPSLFLAIQPQYTFSISKDAAYPPLNVLLARIFLAKFTQSGFFFVIEPRPMYNFENKKFDLIISPLVGKSLGGGFNLIILGEIPTNKETIDDKGVLVQLGFNKNF